jgi:VanZ family protein
VVLTHIPQETLGVDLGTFGLDKIIHLGAYSVISLFSFLAVNPGKRYLGWMIVLMVLFLLAAADEITQPFFGRTCSFYDFLADGIGIVAVFINLFHYRQSYPSDIAA